MHEQFTPDSKCPQKWENAMSDHACVVVFVTVTLLGASIKCTAVVIPRVRKSIHDLHRYNYWNLINVLFHLVFCRLFQFSFVSFDGAFEKGNLTFVVVFLIETGPK